MRKTRPKIAINPESFCRACEKREIGKRQVIPIFRKMQQNPEEGEELPDMDGVYVWKFRPYEEELGLVYLIDSEKNTLQAITITELAELKSLTRAERMMLSAHIGSLIIRILQLLID